MQLQKQREEIIKRSVWPDLSQVIVCSYTVFTLPTCRATHSLRQQKHRKNQGHTELIGTTKVLLLLLGMCASLKMQLRKALERENAPARLQNLSDGFHADLVKIYDCV